MAQNRQKYQIWSEIAKIAKKKPLTFIMFRCFIGHNIAKNFAIGLNRRVLADLQREVTQT